MNKKYFFLTNVHAVFFLAALVGLPMLFQYAPTNDCAMRYAPIAEAFSSGDFSMAFHSRFLPLYPILTGSVCFLLKCSGYFACKLVCWLAFSFSVYPLFYLVKLVNDKKTVALVSSYLLIFCYPLISFIGGGTRANLKSFLIICLAWAFIGSWKYGKLKYLLWAAVFAALLTLTRGDVALYAVIVLGTLLTRQIFMGKVKFMYEPILAGLLSLSILFPWLCFQYNNIGYPVPETRHGMLLHKMSETIPAIKLLYNQDAKYDIVTGNANLFTRKIGKPSVSGIQAKAPVIKVLPVLRYHKDNDTLNQNIIKFFKALFPFYMIIAIAGIILRIKEKSWNRFETILLLLFLGHTLLVIAQVLIADHKLYVSQRYIQPTIPLYLIWGAVALLYIYKKFKDFWGGKFRYLLFFAGLVAIMILLQQGYKEVIRENIANRAQIKDFKKISKIINEQNLPHISGHNTALACNFNISPTIIMRETTIGYYSRCQVIALECAHQNMAVINKLIADGVIHFIVIPHKDAGGFPALNNKALTKELYRGKQYALWVAQEAPISK